MGNFSSFSAKVIIINICCLYAHTIRRSLSTASESSSTEAMQYIVFIIYFEISHLIIEAWASTFERQRSEMTIPLLQRSITFAGFTASQHRVLRRRIMRRSDCAAWPIVKAETLAIGHATLRHDRSESGNASSSSSGQYYPGQLPTSLRSSMASLNLQKGRALRQEACKGDKQRNAHENIVGKRYGKGHGQRHARVDLRQSHPDGRGGGNVAGTAG